jgi:hypothetical protein
MLHPLGAHFIWFRPANLPNQPANRKTPPQRRHLAPAPSKQIPIFHSKGIPEGEVYANLFSRSLIPQ